jgi:hypothetical protein
MGVLIKKIFTLNVSSGNSFTITPSMGFSNLQVTAFDSNNGTMQGFTITGNGLAGSTQSASASLRTLSLSLGSNNSGTTFDSLVITNVDADYCTIIAW